MKLGFKPIPLAIAAVLCALVLALPVPDGVKPQAWTLLAMFVGVIAAIIGKVMPLGALSIIAVGLVAVTGVTADKPGAAMSDALSAFANPLIWLIAIAVMISRGLLKTGLGMRIGYLFIAVFGRKTLGIGYSLALSELLLAPVTPSNTARGGGIIIRLCSRLPAVTAPIPQKAQKARWVNIWLWSIIIPIPFRRLCLLLQLPPTL